MTRFDEEAMNIHKALNSVFEFIQNGNLKQAEKDCKKILKHTPNNADSLHLLGMIYYELGEHTRAIDYIKKAIQIDPDFAEALNNLAVLDMDAGNDVMAKDKLVRALTLRPDYPEANLNLAMILEREGANAEAVKHYLTFLRNAQDEKPLFLEDVRKHVIEIEE